MSLISEALKQTQHAAARAANQPPTGAPSYQLVSIPAPTPEKTLSNKKYIIYGSVAAGIVILASVSYFLFFRGGNKEVEIAPPVKQVALHKPQPQVIEPVVTTSQPAALTPAPTEARVSVVNATPVPVEQPKVEPVATPAPPVVQQPVVQYTPPPSAPLVQHVAKPTGPLPRLVLQGITGDTRSREAMINGVNLREGEEIDGVEVVTIETRRVKLKYGDREIFLRMP